jgi:hypothetical protein
MKTLKFTFTFILLFSFLGCNQITTHTTQSVNAIIGDLSFIDFFGKQPNKNYDETLRLQTHLNYAENQLRKSDVSHLTEKQLENRQTALNFLHEYWTNGVFPKNYDYSDQRIPCFIDKEGNICAVGYLIEKTAGRTVAEKINNKFKYEYLLAMNDNGIDSWMDTYGLTKKECAMIQPTYEPINGENYITPNYGVSSSFLSGLNLSLNVLNGMQISKDNTNYTAPILGLITGIGQVTLGALNYPKEELSWGYTTVNNAQRNLSLINIGLGTSTVLLSSWNLLQNKKAKQNATTINFYPYSTVNGNAGVGFNLVKKF